MFQVEILCAGSLLLRVCDLFIASVTVYVTRTLVILCFLWFFMHLCIFFM